MEEGGFFLFFHGEPISCKGKPLSSGAGLLLLLERVRSILRGTLLLVVLPIKRGGGGGGGGRPVSHYQGIISLVFIAGSRWM